MAAFVLVMLLAAPILARSDASQELRNQLQVARLIFEKIASNLIGEEFRSFSIESTHCGHSLIR